MSKGGTNMRENLFRGVPKKDYYAFSQIWKDCCKNGFVYGSLFVNKNDNKYYILVSTVGTKINSCINNFIGTAIEVVPETVGEFTGQTDCNGKKIFEGDIIKQTNLYDNLEMTGVVVFSKSSQFVIHHTYTKNENFFKEGKKKAFALRSNCRIIGNIHDNPELLEV